MISCLSFPFPLDVLFSFLLCASLCFSFSFSIFSFTVFLVHLCIFPLILVSFFHVSCFYFRFFPFSFFLFLLILIVFFVSLFPLRFPFRLILFDLGWSGTISVLFFPSTIYDYSPFFLSLPCIKRRNSYMGSLSRPPSTVCVFHFRREKVSALSPLPCRLASNSVCSSRYERSLSNWLLFIVANTVNISPQWDSNSGANALDIRI